MKTSPAILAAVALLSASLAPLEAAVPDGMTYQGFLTDINGGPVGAGAAVSRTLEFRIYTEPTGGTPIWGERQVVDVFNGNFSIVLGNGVSLDGGIPTGREDLAQTLINAPGSEFFFGIKPDGEAEFSPRQQMLSSAFSYRAKRADVADSLVSAGGHSLLGAATATNFTVDGHSKINGSHVLEFGVNHGDPKFARGGPAGQIGYKTYSDGLDIVGAGTSDAQRRVTIWAEGGTSFSGPVHFGTRLGQHVNLWSTNHGIGVQENVSYYRSSHGFAWYAGGAHNDAGFNGGGGAVLMTMEPGVTQMHGGSLWIHNGWLDLPNGAIARHNHGIWIQSAGGGHEMGTRDQVTYLRGPNLDFETSGGLTARMDGDGMRMFGNRFIEMGAGVEGKEPAAGIIGYKRFSDSLDIVGAGTNGGNRKVKVWAEGGTEFTGGATVHNGATIHGDLHINGRIWLNGVLIETGNHRGGPGSNDFNENAVKIHAGLSVYKSISSMGWVKSKRGMDANQGNDLVFSDRRLKKEIETIAGASERLGRIRGVSHGWNETAQEELGLPDRKQLGVIAQEVQEVFPELVREEGDYLRVDYPGLIPVVIEALKEKDREIEALRGELAGVQERSVSQEERLRAIEARLATDVASK